MSRIAPRSIVLFVAVGLVGIGLASNASAEGEPGPSDVVIATGCVNTSPVQVIGGTGTFSGPVPCAPPFDVVPSFCGAGSDDTSGSEATDCNGAYTVNGTYDNLVCGTGTATGLFTLSRPDAETIAFTIVFIAGQGIFVGRSGLSDGESGEWEYWSGPVDIVPTAPLVPTCPVTQFRFTTTLVALDLPVSA